jgi:hypothetical protein
VIDHQLVSKVKQVAEGGFNGERVIKAAIPNCPDSIMDHILWGRTPYPFAKVTPRSLYKAAARFKRAQDHGLELCDFCDRIATHHNLCDVCRTAMDAVRNPALT